MYTHCRQAYRFILVVDQILEHLRIMHISCGALLTQDQLALRIHLGVVLVTVMRFGVFLRPMHRNLSACPAVSALKAFGRSPV